MTKQKIMKTKSRAKKQINGKAESQYRQGVDLVNKLEHMDYEKASAIYSMLDGYEINLKHALCCFRQQQYLEAIHLLNEATVDAKKLDNEYGCLLYYDEVFPVFEAFKDKKYSSF